MNPIDMGAILFSVAHMAVGYGKGLKKSLYQSLRFIISLALTYLIFSQFMLQIEAQSVYQNFASSVNSFIILWIPTEFASVRQIIPFLKLDRFVFAILCLIALSAVLRLLFGLQKKENRIENRIGGLLFGLFKAVLYLFTLYVIGQPLLQLVNLHPDGSALLQGSELLRYLSTIKQSVLP